MTSFGSELRRRRVAAGLRQVDLVEALGGSIARSTLANVEVGREPPTERLWGALLAHRPEWARELANLYETARRDTTRVRHANRRSPAPTLPLDSDMDGSFLIQSVNYTYVFGHSRAPEEILEVRRVTALTSGVHSYALRFAHNNSTALDLTQEALWGGQLGDHEIQRDDGTTVWLRRFDFDRRLRKGQTHEFALRSWIAADAEPEHAVCFDLTVPAREVTINLLFNGPHPPQEVWSYEARPEVANPTEDEPPTHPDDPSWLYPDEDGRVHCRWRAPDLGVTHGVAWSW